MDGFAVNCNGKGMVCLGFSQGMQERNSPNFQVTFDCELYWWIYNVDMVHKYLFIGLLLNDKNVIHIPEPMPGEWGQTGVILFQDAPYRSWPNWTYGRPYWCSFNLFIGLVFEREVCVVQTEP